MSVFRDMARAAGFRGDEEDEVAARLEQQERETSWRRAGDVVGCCVACGALPEDVCGLADDPPASCRLTQTDVAAMGGVDDPAPGELETEAAAAKGAEVVEVIVDDPAAAEIRAPRKAEVVVHPRTGEIVEIIRATPTTVLAELRDAIVEWERSDIAGWKRAIDAEIRARLDHESVRSAEIGKWKVTVPAPTKTAWDGERAYKAARELVRDGLISETAAGRAVERVVEYKPKHAELKKLAEHADERVRAAIGGCRTTVDVDPKDRRVTVTPIRTGRSERDGA